jgi:hypothetical protein
MDSCECVDMRRPFEGRMERHVKNKTKECS